jgi:hypothetical protein
MRRFLIVLAVVFAGSVIIYGAGLALFGYSLTRTDPYPNFMAEYQLRGEESLRDSEAKFRDYAEIASDWFWGNRPSLADVAMETI